ncbi:hypothetical protein Tsubulata_004216 [Turnera subulata]|uniref:Uncharacterized protein n=1 Tax=Turnera subulata TaxID=218843 RepID=A0A9Q0FR88_9ROSI|nr:hypothetical protein Tsubulata_004216 [Turnera subulata]
MYPLRPLPPLADPPDKPPQQLTDVVIDVDLDVTEDSDSLHVICMNCGRYGHKAVTFQFDASEVPLILAERVESENAMEMQPELLDVLVVPRVSPSVFARKTSAFGVWMVVSRMRSALKLRAIFDHNRSPSPNNGPGNRYALLQQDDGILTHPFHLLPLLSPHWGTLLLRALASLSVVFPFGFTVYFYGGSNQSCSHPRPRPIMKSLDPGDSGDQDTVMAIGDEALAPQCFIGHGSVSPMLDHGIPPFFHFFIMKLVLWNCRGASG